MLGILLGLVDPVSRIFAKIAEAKIAATTAATDKEKIRADERVKALEITKDALVAEASGSRANQFFRIFISMPAAVILWKIVVWDMALGWGVTDNPSAEVWGYILGVCGFYLLNRTVQVARR